MNGKTEAAISAVLEAIEANAKASTEFASGGNSTTAAGYAAAARDLGEALRSIADARGTRAR